MRDRKKQIETLRAKAKEEGWVPMWTHYYRTGQYEEKVLGATTCLLLDGEGNVISRGVTVVSTKDIPSKVFGRTLSLKRAYGAAVSKETIEEAVCTWGLEEDPAHKISYLSKYEFKAERYPHDVDLSQIELSRLQTRTKRQEAATG